VISDTGAILTSTPTHQDDAVLLDIVALAGNVRRDHASAGQAYTCRLTLARVGLLGTRDTDFQANTLLLRRVRLGQGRGDGVTRAFARAAFLGEEEGC
jgi:hypothetical protein